MAGIIIPIAIHMWNVRQGKVVEVGTIRFMDPSQKKPASNLRISEWLLLLLRCLMIMLFAIVMAGPIWRKSAGTDEKGWLLIAPNELKEAYKLLFMSDLNTAQAIEGINKLKPFKELQYLVDFIKGSKRGICKYKYSDDEYFE